MRTLNKIDSPARERAMSAYDHILQEGIEKGMEKGMEKGFMKAAFLTFKKGVPMGLSVDDLITLTSIPSDTAFEWHALLTQNPEAELPAA